ncbi:ATP-NAD kinase family protein [Desulfurococcus mucosus]|uniref:ATP-NAD/AcoX kinase n=1 Tax=Desulfurococcus mucosus (strain ATCC 35584 / DSM 2162 / JCM 9187 / O7/1) TaxID=765177 RepID=E8RA03_DESM0|nr:ATP-NAD kinase family protein [Desulfurococcus mucosus]ADV65329.1 ATP-NAD/AcoX kinase [Desulfurococcus mucosus DSM 2162]
MVQCSRVVKVGFIVNPIAGMGGRVGLKGTDGEAYKTALERGAEPVSPRRAVEFLNHVSSKCFEIYSAPGIMGADEVSESVHRDRLAMIVGSTRKGASTTREDTVRIAGEMKRLVDILVFVGGDGTARDIHEAVDGELPVLGVPSGVKMYSSVFAVNPRAAAELLVRFINGETVIEEREVVDVDEHAFRLDRVSLRIYGYVKTPVYHGLLQSSKSVYAGMDEELNKEAIAEYIVETMEHGTPYILGPGSTVKAVCSKLGVSCTLLGVDVVLNGGVVVKDAWEKHLLEILDTYGTAKLVVTPIGGQGFLFGRGNQQLSPRVLSLIGRSNVIVVATESKIRQLKELLIDTGDPAVDKMLEGYYKVVVGYGRYRVVKAVSYV